MSKSFSEPALPWQSFLSCRCEQLLFSFVCFLPLLQLGIVVLNTIQELNKPTLPGKIDHTVGQAVSFIIHSFMCYMTCELNSDKDYIFSQITDKRIEWCQASNRHQSSSLKMPLQNSQFTIIVELEVNNCHGFLYMIFC